MHHAINECQLRLDVQRFLWPVYYISYIILYNAGPLNSILGCNLTNCIEDLRTKLAGFKSCDIATKTLPVSQTLTQLEKSGVQTMRV